MFIGEKPIHIECSKEDIAPIVLMPGDPLRAKYIAEKFLTDAKLVTDVRNMYGFTGYYKGIKLTVMGSGMGMPSMGIYAFELFYFYDVKKIIRIGTCGVIDPSVEVPEIIVADNLFTESRFAYLYSNEEKHEVKPNEELLENIKVSAKELNSKVHFGTIMTTDVFGPYIDMEAIIKRLPENIKPLGEEMEGFALVFLANLMNRKAAVMATAVDSIYSSVCLTPDEREQSLKDMITLALESLIK